jgi:uracil-DNA glycosylase
MNPQELSNRIHKDWLNILSDFIITKEFDNIFTTLKEEAKSYEITPKSKDLFKAFTYPFKEVKCVIIGQDVYPTKSVADGLAFSSRVDYEPKSLWYIYNAIEEMYFNGLNLNMERRVNLDFLAEQGVLLTNCALTCRINEAGSHLKLWQPFIQYLVKTLNEKKMNIVYLLLGKEAHKLKKLININLNTVISISHPASAAYTGQKWNHQNCFVAVNEELKHYGHDEILWDYSQLNKI